MDDGASTFSGETFIVDGRRGSDVAKKEAALKAWEDRLRFQEKIAKHETADVERREVEAAKQEQRLADRKRELDRQEAEQKARLESLEQTKRRPRKLEPRSATKPVAENAELVQLKQDVEKMRAELAEAKAASAGPSEELKVLQLQLVRQRKSIDNKDKMVSDLRLELENARKAAQTNMAMQQMAYSLAEKLAHWETESAVREHRINRLEQEVKEAQEQARMAQKDAQDRVMAWQDNVPARGRANTSGRTWRMSPPQPNVVSEAAAALQRLELAAPPARPAIKRTTTRPSSATRPRKLAAIGLSGVVSKQPATTKAAPVAANATRRRPRKLDIRSSKPIPKTKRTNLPNGGSTSKPVLRSAGQAHTPVSATYHDT